MTGVQTCALPISVIVDLAAETGGNCELTQPGETIHTANGVIIHGPLNVPASLKVPFFKTFWRVTLPICTPTLIEVARYFFINAMTTISAVVFLYSPDTKVAAIAILNLDEAGEAGPAAACAVLITAGSTVVTLLFMALGWWVDRRTQAWRNTTTR